MWGLEGNFGHTSQRAHLADEETETVKSAYFLCPLREQVVKLDMLMLVQSSHLISTLYSAQPPRRVTSRGVTKPTPQ